MHNQDEAPVQFKLYDQLGAVEQPWRALQAQGLSTPFEGFDWCAAWMAAAGQTARAAVVTAEDGEGVAALFPWRLERAAGLRRLTWMAEGPSCHHAPVLRAGLSARLDQRSAGQLLRQALATAGGADLAHLPRQPVRIGADANPFAGAQDAVVGPLRTHAMKVDADGETLLRRVYRKRTRQRFVAFQRRMADRKDYRRLPPGPAAADAMARLVAWKRLQTAQRGEASMMNDPAFAAFLADYAGRPGAELEMAVLSVDAEPIAIAAIQLRPGRHIVYQFAFDPQSAYVDESPGRMLARRLILDAAAAGVGELDFTIGDEPYKLTLCDRTEPLMDQWIGLTPLGAGAAALHRANAAARARLGPHTRLGRALRTALGRPTPKAAAPAPAGD